MYSLLTDSCFWIGLFDEEDQYYEKSKEFMDVFSTHLFVIPWPCLYETISDGMIGHRDRMIQIERVFIGKNINVEMLDDSKYRDMALSSVFDYNKRFGFTHSFADAIIRQMILDDEIKIDGFLTYNVKDFKDVCDIRRIEIYN